jgi:hypothetical protein
MEAGWEKSVKKHIFVLSSAGKPIFSRSAGGLRHFSVQPLALNHL